MARRSGPGLVPVAFLWKGCLWSFEISSKSAPRWPWAFPAGWTPPTCCTPPWTTAPRCGPTFVKTAFQPQFELEDARRLCAQLGVELTVLELDVLADPRRGGESAGPVLPLQAGAVRQALRERALADGFSVLIDGTNASDDAGDRPGMRALGELSVRSPLRECGITKAQVRAGSPRRRGCSPGTSPPTPAWPPGCPPGQAVTGETSAKGWRRRRRRCSALGFRDLRVRVFHGAARLQLPGDQLEGAVHRAGGHPAGPGPLV